MKIVKAEVFVTCPGRNFVTLKITTEDGITGLGDATLNGRELSVASYLPVSYTHLITSSFSSSQVRAISASLLE